MRTLIIAQLISCIFFSCTVQKRHYQKGFYVAKRSHKTTNAKESAVLRPHELPEIVAKADQMQNAYQSLPDAKHTNLEDSCDVMVMQDGTEQGIKITEILPETIKYKRCDFLNGPSYEVRKSEVFMIVYANGSREVFHSPAQKKTPTSSGTNNYRNYIPQKNIPIAAKFSLASAVAAATLAFASFLVLTFGVFPLTTYFLIATIVLCGVAIATGIYANTDIKNNPDELRGRGLTIPGIIIASIIMLLFLIILLSIFL